MTKIFLAVFLALTVCGLMTGCQSDAYYKEQAVIRARDYVLKNAPELTTMQREYIRYNKPLIMARSILGEYPEAQSSMISQELSHVCIAWVVPEAKEAYVVFGVSDNRLFDWTPNRLIRKYYKIKEFIRLSAEQNATSYVMQNMLYLSLEQRNRIRFAIPESAFTKFEIEYNPLGETKQVEVNRLKQLTQQSFYWPSVTPGKKIVVCGLGSPDLSGWMPMFGQEMDDAEFNRYLTKAPPVPAPKPEKAKPAGKNPTAASPDNTNNAKP